MSGQQQARKRQIHSADVRRVYERVLAGASVRSCHVEVAGDRVHLLEKSTGSPVVLLHGNENSARFLLAIAERTRGGPPRDGRASVAVGATQPEISAAVREVRGREGDPCRSPGLGRLDGGHGPGPDRRRKRQGRDTRVGRAVRLAVAFWVPASFQRATRRAAPAGNAHAGGMG